MTSNSNILLQCTRLGKAHSYPVDLIIDTTYTKTLYVYEHTSYDHFNQNRTPLDIDSVKGELFEIDAIKCDPNINTQSLVDSFKEHLNKFHIELSKNSLNYLKDITWPSDTTRIRCAIDNTDHHLRFYSPTSFEPKVINSSRN